MATLSANTMFATAFVPSPSNLKRPTASSVLLGLKGQTSIKSARGGVKCAAYTVKLITPEGEVSFECPDDVYIVDQAEEKGIDVPFSCRAGSCSSCTGKLVSGTVDQSDNQFLDDEQLGRGFILTCVAYPTSDVVIETHKEDDL